jgi:tripeptide aminopeptidase
VNLNRQRLLERFLRYVQIDTTARDGTEQYPSSPGQLELGKMLVAELQAMGLEDAEQDPYGLVYATLPAAPGCQTAPVIALNSHLDTSPETTGCNVRPQVIESYAGGDIVLPGDPRQVIRVAESPELAELVGRTLVTTDGTTLLGGDDKAGVAIIMELAATLTEQPELPHGPIRILFTCDEEIGRGVRHVDLAKLGAVVGYTLDGGGADEIDVETFSADRATVTLRGVNIHPAIAKDRMVNALRAAGQLLAQLPRDHLAPEATSGREGFIHPYQMQGSVAEAKIQFILRDFETERLQELAGLLEKTAEQVRQTIPGIECQVEVQPQYRNLADGLRHEPRAVAYARRAHERLGRTPRLTIIRGGTDGSLLTAQGLPTPNLSSGQHNLHSPLEWVCLDEMLQALEVLVTLAAIWSEDQEATPGG